MEGDREHIRLEMESRSSNEEFARVVAAVFMSRLDPTLEEMDDVKTAVSEAVSYGADGRPHRTEHDSRSD